MIALKVVTYEGLYKLTQLLDLFFIRFEGCRLIWCNSTNSWRVLSYVCLQDTDGWRYISCHFRANCDLRRWCCCAWIFTKIFNGLWWEWYIMCCNTMVLLNLRYLYRKCLNTNTLCKWMALLCIVVCNLIALYMNGRDGATDSTLVKWL